MIAITSLLAIAAITTLSVQTELQASAQSRMGRAALYASESGISAGMDFLRNNCSTTNLFSAWLSANNASPQKPAAIIGNQKTPGQTGNPFTSANNQSWYEVSIYNNLEDPGLAAGTDNDGVVILRSVGHGQDNTVAVLEATIQASQCLAIFCASEYAQRNVDARNDANAACSQVVSNSGVRTFNP